MLESAEAATRLSPSKVLLSRLPEEQRSALEKHNGHVLSVFEGYIVNFCTHAKEKLGRDVELPLSKASLGVIGHASAKLVPFFVARFDKYHLEINISKVKSEE